MRTMNVLVAAVLLGIGFGGPACFEGTEGELGTLTFVDMTKGPSVTMGRPIDRSVAVGAILLLRVESGTQAVRPESATLSPEGVFVVDTLTTDGVRLFAERAGEATLRVRADGREDTLRLVARTPEEMRVHFFPLGWLAEEGVLGETGLVLTPGARAWGWVEHRAGGSTLTGHGAVPCTVDRGSFEMDAAGDVFTLDAPSEGGAGVRIACGTTGIDVPVASADTVVRLGVYDFFGEQVGPRFAGVEVGTTKWLVVTAFDAEGRLVQGGGAEAVEVLLPEAYTGAVVAEDVTDDSEIDSFLAANRAVSLRFEAVGGYDVPLRWHGLDVTASFEVVAR